MEMHIIEKYLNILFKTLGSTMKNQLAKIDKNRKVSLSNLTNIKWYYAKYRRYCIFL